MNDGANASTTRVTAPGAHALRIDVPVTLPTIGTSLGRYVVVGIVGRGAMGHVLRAYDPKLEREVALKVVRADALDSEARSRMLREARAMAQLSHPNVVAVYDAEDSDIGVVIVMEYVLGQTLRQWSRAATQTWQDTVELYILAGHGVAAAHAQGLLHRDFKASNVLVAETGELKVTDFGLAKLASATGTRESAVADSGEAMVIGSNVAGASPSSEDSEDSLGGMLTRVGEVLGTPRYMAPEQHRLAVLDASVDQYALCVSLWEALSGKPPFRGKDVKALLADKERCTPTWPAQAAPIPAAIMAALQRGLAARPDQRWPNMVALLSALHYDPAQRRRRWLAALAGIAVVGSVGLGLQAWRSALATRCTGAQAQLEGIWDDTRREQARTAMAKVGVSYAIPVWEHTQEELDRYAQAWVRMHTDACEATSVRGEQSTEVLDLRMACLHHAKVGLQAATQVLINADAGVVQRAHTLVGGLPGLPRCADVHGLRADVEPAPPQDRDTVETIRTSVAQLRAELNAGRFDRAQAELERVEGLLPGLEYRPVRTEVALAHASVLIQQGKYERAREALHKALGLASRSRQWAAMQDAAVQLIFVVGDRLRRMDEGLLFRELAEGLAAGDPRREANVHNAVALALHAQGKYQQAEHAHRQALALRERSLGPEHPATTDSRNNLATLLAAQGKHAQAEAEIRSVLKLRTQALGPQHPVVGNTRNNLANVLHALGKNEQAETQLRLSLAIQRSSLGSEHPNIAQGRNNLAVVLTALGKYNAAETEYRSALAVWEKTLGLTHPAIAVLRDNLGNILSRLGRYEEAEAECRAALAVRLSTVRSDHPDIAISRANLADILNKRGRHQEAEREARKALALTVDLTGGKHGVMVAAQTNLADALLGQAKLQQADAAYRIAIGKMVELQGTKHSDVALTQTSLADVLLQRGDFVQGLELAQTAWSSLQDQNITPQQRANAAFVLARALRAAGPVGDTYARAHALAQQALRGFESMNDQQAGMRVQAWLLAQP